MNSIAHARPQPWYRQRWPWILIAIPASSVVVGFTLLYFAITSADGLVVDDYYRQGRAIDQTIARSVHAADLGLVAHVGFTPDRVSIRLAANEIGSLPTTVIVTIAHPTRSGRDQQLRLAGPGGEFSGRVEPLTDGRWLVQIEDEAKTWRLRGPVHLPVDTQAKILPYDS